MAEMVSFQSQAESLLTLLVSGSSVHSSSVGFSHVKPADLRKYC